MHPYLQPLVTTFQAAADPAEAGPMKAYMRDRFPFLGIKAPARTALTKAFWQAQGPPPRSALPDIIRDLWALPEREYQYAAVTLLQRSRRRLDASHVPLVEVLICTKSWWDTVDSLASHVVGDLFARFPELRDATVAVWRRSDNLWLRRTTLLFQLRYKEKSDVALLFSLIQDNLGSDEFFINKAIGWALRELSKTNEAAVRDFVATTSLAPLSEREALKWLARRDEKG